MRVNLNDRNKVFKAIRKAEGDMQLARSADVDDVIDFAKSCQVKLDKILLKKDQHSIVFDGRKGAAYFGGKYAKSTFFGIEKGKGGDWFLVYVFRERQGYYVGAPELTGKEKALAEFVVKKSKWWR